MDKIILFLVKKAEKKMEYVRIVRNFIHVKSVKKFSSLIIYLIEKLNETN